MSALGAILTSSPFGAATSAGVDPFGGATEWGFDIPQGNPGEIGAAARAATEASFALLMQSQDVTQSIHTALAGWQGEAQAAFAAYAGHVSGVLNANSEALATAAQAMSQLATELEHAQLLTREAARQCSTYHAQMVTAQQDAGQYASTARTLEQQAAAAAHPQMQGELNAQAAAARGDAASAERAAASAQHEFELWQKRGRDADEVYAHQAQGLSGRIAGAADEIREVQPPAGGAPVPVALSPSDVALARRMLIASGGLAAAAKAAGSPAALERLAGGHLTPGAALLFVQSVQKAIADTPKPQQGSILDGIGGYVNTATFGLISFGNPNTARYRGGALAALIPLDPDAWAVDAERGGVKIAEVLSKDGKLGTMIDGHLFEVVEGDSTALTSRPDPGRVVYRVYGQPADEGGVVPMPGDRYSGPGGHSWSPVSPARYKDARESLGLPDANGGRFVLKGRITDSSGILVRHALPLDGTRGGGLEYVVPDPEGQIEIISVGGVNPPY